MNIQPNILSVIHKGAPCCRDWCERSTPTPKGRPFIMRLSVRDYTLRNLINGSKLFSLRQGEQMAPEIEQPFGIRVLMWLSLLTGLWAILDLVLFIHPIHPVFLSRYTLPETRADRAASIVFGLAFM